MDSRSQSSVPITDLIRLSKQGDAQARDYLFRTIWGQLRRIAAAALRKERYASRLEPTELVNEAYCRLFGNRDKEFVNRDHFFRVAAQAMRFILIDISRRRQSEETLSDTIPTSDRPNPEKMLAFDQALTRLEQFDPRAAEALQLRVFMSQTDEEIARILGVCDRTVARDIKAAKSWLRTELGFSPVLKNLLTR